MNETVSTIYYNGQFWVALIERYSADGRRSLAEFTFGPEPAAGDLLDFYLNKYEKLSFTDSDRKERIRKPKKDNHKRILKSHTEFKESQKKMLEQRKAEKKHIIRLQKEEKYRQKIQKKKQKKKGH